MKVKTRISKGTIYILGLVSWAIVLSLTFFIDANRIITEGQDDSRGLAFSVFFVIFILSTIANFVADQPDDSNENIMSSVGFISLGLIIVLTMTVFVLNIFRYLFLY